MFFIFLVLICFPFPSPFGFPLPFLYVFPPFQFVGSLFSRPSLLFMFLALTWLFPFVNLLALLFRGWLPLLCSFLALAWPCSLVF